MLLTSVLALVAFTIGVFAAPLNIAVSPTTSLIKRAAPSISGDFSTQATEQIQRGFNDVLQLAAAVVSEAKTNKDFDRMFARYFDIKDRQFVLSVFASILGNDKTKGNVLLGDINVVVDYRDAKGRLNCDSTDGRISQAALLNIATPKPNLVLCNSALKHGAIDHHFDGVADVNCQTLDPRVSTKMETLGGILLHEYTHWRFLMKPLFKTLKLSQKVEATGDQRYGPIEVKRLATSKTYRAMVNADSYTWLAYEVFWTAYCKKPFDPADPAKDDDRTLFDNS